MYYMTELYVKDTDNVNLIPYVGTLHSTYLSFFPLEKHFDFNRVWDPKLNWVPFSTGNINVNILDCRRVDNYFCHFIAHNPNAAYRLRFNKFKYGGGGGLFGYID